MRYEGVASRMRLEHGKGQMRLAGSCPANQRDVALLGQKAAAGQIARQPLVDRRFGEVIDVRRSRRPWPVEASLECGCSKPIPERPTMTPHAVNRRD